MKFMLASLFAFSVAAGCASPGIDAAHLAIINGVASGAEDDAAIGLGIFSGTQFQGACSGVLVAPNLVLTARHCVSKTEEGNIGCQSDGTPIVGGGVLGDYKPGQLKVLLGSQLANDFAAIGMTIMHPDVTNLCDNDIAMLVLDKAIAGNPTIAQLRLDTMPNIGDTIRAVGWGTSNNSSGIERRKRDNIAIIDVGPDDSTGLGDRELAIGEGICSGDSGGPAFDEVTKAVVGVVSRGGNGAPYNPQTDPQYTPCVDSGPYHANNIYTRTDGFKDFILSGFAAAGADPWVEGGPDPRKAKFGVACTTGDDCRSALCVQGICSEPCDSTFCPDGYSCQVVSGASVCTVPPPKTGGCSAAPGSTHSAGTALLLLLLLAVAAVVRRRST